MITHTDGENKQLLGSYLRAGFDIADSVCPYPMTRCRLEEIRAAFADRVTIWGGIPSTLLCPASTPADEFRRSIDQLIERYKGESHFILGVSDMVTGDADWDRLQYVTKRVAETRSPLTAAYRRPAEHTKTNRADRRSAPSAPSWYSRGKCLARVILRFQ